MATKKRAKKVMTTPAPKKRPPPKKRSKPKVKTRKAVVMAPEVVKVEIPTDANGSQNWLRYAAGLQYTTDLNGRSVRALCEDPMFASVPLSTMEKWSLKDNWSPRRRELLDRWRAQIEARVGDRLIQHKMLLVDQMEKIQTQLFKRLMPLDHDWEAGDIVNYPGKLIEPVEICKVCGLTRMQHLDPFLGVSGDKAVDALLKLIKVREEMAEAIMHVTTKPGYGMGAAAGLTPQVGLDKPKLSTDEVRSAAMAILKRRRQKTLGGDDAAT